MLIEHFLPVDREFLLVAESQPCYPEVPIPLALVTETPGSLAAKTPTGLGSTHLVEYIKSTARSEPQLDPILLNASLRVIEKSWVGSPVLGFIDQFCEWDNFKIYVITTLCQTIIMSGAEGGNYQSAYWLFGLASKSRDVILTILKVLADQGGVMEISRASEIVSIPTLVTKKLVLVTEIKTLTAKTSIQLKETIKKTTLWCKCQLVFHGTDDPVNCGSFYDISGD